MSTRPRFVISRFVVTVSLAVSLFVAGAADLFAVNNPPVTRRTTMRQLDPRRSPHPFFDERSVKPMVYRPTIGRSWFFNGRARYSSHYQTTVRNMYSLSGRRTVPDRAGRMRINNNRRQIIRRRSARHRW